MFGTGFLGTSAPFYMDFITVYFALLPVLMFFSILLAVKKQYEKHFLSQLILFAVTLVVVVVFEVGVRVSDGFIEFMQNAHVSYGFMITFLVVHVSIALVSVILWSALLYGAIKSYKLENKGVSASHKKVGKLVFLGMSIASYMGVGVYYLLFLY
jgi:putative membrane protein